MKVTRYFVPAIMIVAAAVLIGHGFVSWSQAVPDIRESAVVELREIHQLHDRFLQGSFLFTHLENPIQGEPCLYVHHWKNGKPGPLVTSLHCRRVDRESVDTFKVIFEPKGLGTLRLVREIQFPGVPYSHRVP